MRIYISGKITGLLFYKEKFAAAEKELTAAGHVVLNPAILPAGLGSHNDYMDISYAMLNKCDAICMLEGWEDSKGAKMEKEYAEARGIKVFYQYDDKTEG